MSSTAEHRESRGHIPGETGVWVFIIGDMVIFGIFFAVFLHDRAGDVGPFLESQAHLNRNLGALNTLLLLSSSWFVVLATNAASQGLTATTGRLLGTAWLGGFAFAVVKVWEYVEKIRAGMTPATDDFFMYYFVLTGIHFMHLLIGLAVLAWLYTVVRRGIVGDREIAMLEGGASYWHMVDLLWIVLFPLLYLVR